MRATLAAVAAALLVGTLVARAQVTPFDVTGDWAGSAQSKKNGTVPIAATFTAGATPTTFTGTVSVTIQSQTVQCPANGKEKRHEKVKIRITPCPIGNTRLRGTFDPAALTITGHYFSVRHGKVQTGPFTITKET